MTQNLPFPFPGDLKSCVNCPEKLRAVSPFGETCHLGSPKHPLTGAFPFFTTTSLHSSPNPGTGGFSQESPLGLQSFAGSRAWILMLRYAKHHLHDAKGAARGEPRITTDT